MSPGENGMVVRKAQKAKPASVTPKRAHDAKIGRATKDAVETRTYSASLVTQGSHKFYSLTMPSEVLAETCTVDTRAENPIDGFQRVLDEKRASEIARYIDVGLGTIPTAIILSAQAAAKLSYRSKGRAITFESTPGSFLILDGQHRVFGFAKAKANLRVPVVIYNGLTRAQECQLFMDINTKQRPVPNELLLDIKRLAETESDEEGFLRDVFDYFESDPNSPLFGRLSASAKRKGRLSRVTFNAALKSIWTTLQPSDPERAYQILKAYLVSWASGLRRIQLEDQLVNPTLFKGIMLLFPDVAQRVFDRHGEDYNVGQFDDVLQPFFGNLKVAQIKAPGTSAKAVHESFKKVFRRQFSIGSV